MVKYVKADYLGFKPTIHIFRTKSGNYDYNSMYFSESPSFYEIDNEFETIDEAKRAALYHYSRSNGYKRVSENDVDFVIDT